MEENKTPNHCIVGIGASAGGMEAVHELFDNMPAGTGCSFVVIQHLSPNHKSLMSELLAKHTLMQVFEATEGMVVKPNCIYVIPSKDFITIKNGKLHLVAKVKNHQPNHAIDIFFESLAIYKKKNAIGIILSGTGTDGTKGIQAIKANNGFVIVQDPMTAAFDGMPNSAIENGSPDLVLPPEMIAEELLEYSKESPLLKNFHKMDQKEEVLLRDILQHLKQITGNDFNYYKRPTLLRRLAKRMGELSIANVASYKQYLKDNPQETKTLVSEFLINVTKFFRDKEAFDVLRTHVIPMIFSDKKKGDNIKVWSMACSSGEEAYSLAILFHDHMMNKKLDVNIKIFATDIDAKSLDTASKGIYPESISKDIPSRLLEQYFIGESNFYRVSPIIRKMVVFANHDILKDPPFSKLDLISCRNMLIYLTAPLQNKILQKFHFAMNMHSYLFLGTSENLGVLSPVMEEVNRKWKIYRCISKSNIVDKDNFVTPLLDSKMYNYTVPIQKPKNILSSLADIFKDVLVEDRSIAGIFIDREFNVKQAIGSFKDFLQFPDGHFNFNLLKMVNPDLAVALGVGVRKATSVNEKVVMKRVTVHREKEEQYVNIIIKPYTHHPDHPQPFLFVVLEKDEVLEVKSNRAKATSYKVSSQDRVDELEKELRSTRENLQAVIEELESANEEMQSTNEEMISTNEELQSTNEELQSLNEELHTVSAEHQMKIKELLEMNDDMDNYFRNSDTGQIFVDAKMAIRKFSPSVTNIVNLISTDVGRSLFDISANIKNINFINDVKEVLQLGTNIEKEIRLSNNQFYLMRINPYIRRDQVAEGVVINFVDITESKRLSAIIEGVFNSSPNGITAKKAIRNNQNEIVDFEFLAVNTSYEELFGKASGEVLGKTMKQVYPTLGNEHLELCIKALETGEMQRLEYFVPQKDKWFDTTVVKMFDGVVTTHADITEKRKDAETIANSYQELKNTSQQLVESNVLLERSNMDLMQFASVASHDLKEPLRKIQTFGNILQSKWANTADNDDQKMYLEKMISASGRMQTLIEDVLTLSKLSNNHLPRTRVDLSKTINRITDDLEIVIKEKKATIVVANLPIIEAVPGQMHQLFQNLISNALKFNDKKTPTITIGEKKLTAKIAQGLGISYIADYVCVTVKDNGIGFESEYEEKVFGLFQRLNSREYEGTGIGLAIAKKIVENHDGIIKATSVLGKGTIFNICLPVK